MGLRVNESYRETWFVFGAIRDREGQRGHAKLEGPEDPGQLVEYLDRMPEGKIPGPGKRTYGWVAWEEGTAYVEYRGVNPSDGRVNRGAYVAVACCARRDLSPGEVAGIVRHASAVHDDLERYQIKERRQFREEFKFEQYKDCGPRRGRDEAQAIVDAAFANIRHRNQTSERQQIVLTEEQIAQGSWDHPSRGDHTLQQEGPGTSEWQVLLRRLKAWEQHAREIEEAIRNERTAGMKLMHQISGYLQVQGRRTAGQAQTAKVPARKRRKTHRMSMTVIARDNWLGIAAAFLGITIAMIAGTIAVMEWMNDGETGHQPERQATEAPRQEMENELPGKRD